MIILLCCRETWREWCPSVSETEDVVKKTLRHAYLFMRRYAFRIGVAAVVAWLAALSISFYYTIVVRDFIDYLVRLVSAHSVDWRGMLTWYAVVLVGLWGARYLLNIIGEYLLQLTAVSTLRGLAIEFISRLIRARPGSMPDKGDVIGRFISDLTKVSELGGLIPALAVQVARLLIGGLLLYVLNIYLFVLAMAAIPVYYAVFRVSSRKLAEASEQERREFAAISTIVKRVVDSLLFIRLCRGVRDYLWSRYREGIKAWGSKLARVLFYDVFFNQSFNSLYEVIRILVLVVGGFLVATGRASVGDVVAFSSAVYQVYEPIANISYSLAALGEVYPYLRRVQEVLKAEAEEEDKGVRLEKVDSIFLRRVTVRVDKRRVLAGVSAEFSAGNMYAVVGPTGSGKTTLLLTIVRYLEPEEGTVLINGLDYRVYSTSSIRSRIVYLPQTPLVFRATLRENIALGRKVREEALLRALSIADVDFVKDLDEVVDPEKLSDGQKQRIALARALVMQPDVLLLDEALNAVDENTEARILAKLRSEITNNRLRMVIIVTHRSSTLGLVDKVYELKQGKLLQRTLPREEDTERRGGR